MYIKWITCEVAPDQKEAFSKAQEKWYRTNQSPGFIAQAGGWDLNAPQTACIISFWEHKNHLKKFMDNLHDEIFHDNKQAQSYQSIEVIHFNQLLEMSEKMTSLPKAIEAAQFLRIADCLVKSEKIEHFTAIQKTVWLPEMQQAKGMLGGTFSNAETDNSRFLVSTFWDKIENHANYADNHLPGLKKLADSNNDLKEISGRQILLVDSWKIVK